MNWGFRCRAFRHARAWRGYRPSCRGRPATSDSEPRGYKLVPDGEGQRLIPDAISISTEFVDADGLVTTTVSHAGFVTAEKYEAFT